MTMKTYNEVDILKKQIAEEVKEKYVADVAHGNKSEKGNWNQD